MEKIAVKNFLIGEKEPLTVIMGPCVIESEDDTLFAAETLKRYFAKTPFQFLFKSSYDKANRSSIASYRGPGLEEGLRILERVRNELDLPVFTDVHSPEEAFAAASVCDVIQIPAFLCRQTDLQVACGKTGCVINVKKGQFMAPWDMEEVIRKITSTGNRNILLTDRGTSFGYNNLVSDFRSLPIMQSFGFPVIYDATHSTQLPGGLGTCSGGQREFILPLSSAAIAAGCQGIFAEAHPNPAKALCDQQTQLPFEALPTLFARWERIYYAVNEECFVSA